MPGTVDLREPYRESFLEVTGTERLNTTGGVLAGTVGSVIGTGTGRGVAALFVVMGLTVAAVVAVTATYPHVRRLDIEIPHVELELDPAWRDLESMSDNAGCHSA